MNTTLLRRFPLLLATALIPCCLNAEQFVVLRMNLIGSQRITRTDFDYVYSVDITNQGAAASAVAAQVKSSSPATVVIDGALAFGNVSAGQAATSLNRLKIRQDRTKPFDPTALTFAFTTGHEPPVANAGPDQKVRVNATVHLTGAASSSFDGRPLTYRWSFVSTPPGVAPVLQDPLTVTPSFVAAAAGNYVLQLVVNDGLVDSAPSTILISTENTPPIADAGQDQNVPPSSTVQLNGSKSSDIDGDPLTFRWSFSSLPAGSSATLSNPSAVSPTFLVDLPGVYVVSLTVNDGQADSSPAVVRITTVPENTPPVADAGPPQTVKIDTTVHLDGSASHDIDGDPLTFRWSLITRPATSTATLSNAAAVNPTFVVDVPGAYVVQLIVNDGKVDGAPSNVTISTENSPPIADAGPDQRVATGSTVQLNGSKSSDVDGDPLTYRWSFSSRPAGSNAVLSDSTAISLTFVADRTGTYVVQLIVNDGKVDSAPSTVTISTENTPPVANAGPDQTVAVGATVILDGSKSTDVDGDPLTYRWSFVSRPNGSTAVLTNSTASNPTFVVDLPGSYVVQLVVNDGKVDSAPVTVVISTVNSPPVANAGPDQSVAPGATVQLDGAGSSDVDKDPLTFRWSLLSRPEGSTATLSDPSSLKPTFVADVAGEYVAQLIVNDGKVDSRPDTVTISARLSGPDVINCGQTVLGRITVPGQRDTYRFSANSGDVVLVSVAGDTTGAVAELYDTSGLLLKSSPTNGTTGPVPLQANGTYTILVRSTFSTIAPVNYGLNRSCLLP